MYFCSLNSLDNFTKISGLIVKGFQYEKCAQYWPPSDNGLVRFGNVEIETTKKVILRELQNTEKRLLKIRGKIRFIFDQRFWILERIVINKNINSMNISLQILERLFQLPKFITSSLQNGRIMELPRPQWS